MSPNKPEVIDGLAVYVPQGSIHAKPMSMHQYLEQQGSGFNPDSPDSKGFLLVHYYGTLSLRKAWMPDEEFKEQFTKGPLNA